MSIPKRLVPAPYRTWQDFFDSDADEDFQLIALERWFAEIRDRPVPPERRYNSYLATETEARTAWGAYRVVMNRLDEVFPGDRAPKEYEGRGDAVQFFRPATDG